jgi:hypothetical protein
MVTTNQKLEPTSKGNCKTCACAAFSRKMDERISLGSDDQPFYESNYTIPGGGQSYEPANQPYGHYGDSYSPDAYSRQGSMGHIEQSQTHETPATFGDEPPLLEGLLIISSPTI